MSATRHLRRRASFALLACIWLVATTAFAQDPRASIVQSVAREWLLLADKLDAAATWKAAGPRFQQSLTQARWAVGLAREREPRGAIVRRTLRATSFGTTFAGLPESGNYALVTFRSSFAQQSNSEEHLTLELGADETWRVIGYVIL